MTFAIPYPAFRLHRRFWCGHHSPVKVVSFLNIYCLIMHNKSKKNNMKANRTQFSLDKFQLTHCPSIRFPVVCNDRALNTSLAIRRYVLKGIFIQYFLFPSNPKSITHVKIHMQFLHGECFWNRKK